MPKKSKKQKLKSLFEDLKEISKKVSKLSDSQSVDDLTMNDGALLIYYYSPKEDNIRTIRVGAPLLQLALYSMMETDKELLKARLRFGKSRLNSRIAGTMPDLTGKDNKGNKGIIIN